MSKHRILRKSLIGDSLIAGVLGVLVFFSAGWSFFRLCTYSGKKKTKSRATSQKKWYQLKHAEVNHPRYHFREAYDSAREWCEAQDMQDWYLRNEEGLKLHATYLRAENPERIVMLCHGFRGSRFGSVAAVAEYLHKNNCSLLFIDQRCCGESEGKYITYGAKERYDVIEWLERIDEINTDRLPVYLYGQSMGATTVLLASGLSLPGEVRGVIADCGFHSMKQELNDIASEWFHLKNSELMLIRVNFFCRILAGFSMKDTDTTEALRRNRLPVLFFHGEDDTYVKPESSKINYRLCRSEKELVLVPGARHLCSSYAAPELYREKLMAFFRKHDM